MKKNRFTSILLKILILVFIVVAYVYISNIIYKHIASDISIIENKYEILKEKNELLHSIVDDFIEESEGINFREIPGNIQYTFYTYDENIIFHYWIIEDSSDTNKFDATITLSNDFKILDKEFSFDSQDFETYQKNSILCERLLSLSYGAIGILFFLLLLSMFL